MCKAARRMPKSSKPTKSLSILRVRLSQGPSNGKLKVPSNLKRREQLPRSIRTEGSESFGPNMRSFWMCKTWEAIDFQLDIAQAKNEDTKLSSIKRHKQEGKESVNIEYASKTEQQPQKNRHVTRRVRT